MNLSYMPFSTPITMKEEYRTTQYHQEALPIKLHDIMDWLLKNDYDFYLDVFSVVSNNGNVTYTFHFSKEIECVTFKLRWM